MPELIEAMYCSQQIFVPPNLPVLLKKYAKAAIRTQPADLLLWSSAYFKALAQGFPPPTKERLEYPPTTAPSGLSPGFLKVLINQIGRVDTVKRELVEERWRGVCLNMDALDDLMDVGLFGDDVHWLHFVAVCAGTLEPNLTRTMVLLCELLTDEPDGGSASVPVDLFLDLYKYLAKIDCGPTNKRELLILAAQKSVGSDGDESKVFDESCERIMGERKESKKLKYGSDVEPVSWDHALGIYLNFTFHILQAASGKKAVKKGTYTSSFLVLVSFFFVIFTTTSYFPSEELKVTSDMSAETIPEVTSDAGIGIWPTHLDECLQKESAPQEKDHVGLVTSEYGLQVFTNVEPSASVELQEVVERIPEVEGTQAPKETIKIERKDSKSEKRRSSSRKSSSKVQENFSFEGDETEFTEENLEEEDEANIFAPKIDSFTDLLEGQEMPVEDEFFGEEEEQLEEEQREETEELDEIQPEPEKFEEEGEPLVTLLSPDSSMERLVTPAHSAVNVETDTSLVPDVSTFKEKISLTQKLRENISLTDVRVSPPEMRTQEIEQTREVKMAKWMDIPGIGPVIPDEMVVEIEKYFKDVASMQCGMVMPRNIRHYRCPPLDVFEE